MKFTKMHGAGNDYVYVNGFEERVADPAALARRVSDRHRGVGADGLILILPSDKADFRMRMFNADGSEGGMCGNGLRCVGKYVFDRGMTRKQEISVETAERTVRLDLQAPGGRVERVRVEMGPPVLDRAAIPMQGPAGRVVDEPIEALGRAFRATCLSMGNPHCVIFVEEVEDFPLARYGPALERHPAFPERVNVHFAAVLSRAALRQRTWERGSGETLACGSGACAAAVAGVLTGRTERRVAVRLDGGELEVEWDPSGGVFMTGPAVEVFRGEGDFGVGP
jgi:diaminopimelate epimerase